MFKIHFYGTIELSLLKLVHILISTFYKLTVNCVKFNKILSIKYFKKDV